MTKPRPEDRCLYMQGGCALPSSQPYPHPGRWAMLLLPLAYVVMGVFYFLALRSPTNGFWYPPIAFGKLMLLVYGPVALLPVLASELVLMGVQYVLVAEVGFVAAGLVSLATTAEGLLAWWLLRRWPIDAGLRRARDLLRLLILGGLVPNVVGAVLGVTLLFAFVDYGDRLAPAALLWATGDFVTTVTWMPAFVLWVGPLLCRTRQRWPRGKQLAELVTILVVSAATCVVVALGIMSRPDLQGYNLKFLCFLPLIWAGVRYGLPGATASLAVASTAWAMLYGNAKPLNLVDLAITIEQVQVFNLALGLGGLVLGWAIDSERRARDVAQCLSEELQAKEEKLREAFDAAARAQERAERAGQIKYRLLSAVSHELRTPLTPTALVLSELAERDDLPAEVRESAEMALHQVEVEASVIEELLEYADLMCGLEIRRCDVRVAALVAPVREAIAREVDKDTTRITWTTPDADMTVWVDERKVARAMLHMIRDAVESCRAGGEVRVTSRVEDDALRVECQVAPVDGGLAARDGEPFAATDQALNGANHGLGLALTNARLIAERHGGSLVISESREQQSATYALRVPCRRES